MGDGLKISKDKRHRSSSSLAGAVLDRTRSERKLEIKGSIHEVDDQQFTIAETRCEDLQEKIDLVKVLKRKRKLKKRSMTRVTDAPSVNDNIPFISVRTQPKKKVSQQTARLRRMDMLPTPTLGYLDPATLEQHRMIGQVRGYSQAFHPQENTKHRHSSGEQQAMPKLRTHRSRADEYALTACDSVGQGVQISCGTMDDDLPSYSHNDIFDNRNELSQTVRKSPVPTRMAKSQPKGTTASRRSNVSKEGFVKEAQRRPERQEGREDSQERWAGSARQRPHQVNRATRSADGVGHGLPQVTSHMGLDAGPSEDRPVVELYKPTCRGIHSPMPRFNKKVRDTIVDDQKTGPLYESVASLHKKREQESHRHPRRVKYRSRRYELPTVASQMKQAGMRYYYESGNATNIPFVATKSTAPSHNIGVNLQQVLNGIKIQQPLSGIPLTIAHHMGLGHIPTNPAKSAVLPSLDNREINVIKLGRRMLRLPSYRYMSYSRLLSLYREGDGMVPRFLRAISRPHFFYTSMYNLATNREDQDGATSKGRAGNQEAKQSLAEYASLYREYERMEECLREGNYDPELERRKEELAKELTAREELIRKVVQEYKTSEMDQSTLRASASTADDTYRHSTFKLTSGDHPHQ